MISIYVPGEPVAKARPKATGMKGKDGNFRARMYTPKKTVNFETKIAEHAKCQMILREPTKGPVCLDLVLFFAIPESWPEWKKQAAQKNHIAHTSKPDSDNVLKAVKDALNKIVYHDDAQVIETHLMKLYSNSPGVMIEVRELTLSPCQITRKNQLLNESERQKAA